MFIDLKKIIFLFEREREKHGLPPVHALSRDRTHNLVVYGTVLQPAKPPGPGYETVFPGIYHL